MPVSAPRRSFVLLSPVIAAAVLAIAPDAARAAGPSADAVLPPGAVGFASITNVPDFRERWAKTQLGQLADLPEMEPFLTQLRDQVTRREGKIQDRLGVTFEELGDATSGEAAFALVEPTGDQKRASFAVIADVSDRPAEAQATVEKIRQRLSDRGATAIETSIDSLEVYSVPRDGEEPREVAFFLTDARFGAADDADVAAAMLANALKPGSALRDNPVYQATLAKTDARLGRRVPTISWWVDPFAYAAASRTLRPASEDADKKDPVAILEREGFDGVKGVGGRVLLAVDVLRDAVHHSAIYAPPKPGTEGKSAAERYDGAMRVAEFPNSVGLAVEAWAPREIAVYKTLNVDVQNLFDNVASLIDSFVYKNAFQNTLEAFEKDPYGPQISLRDEVVAHLGQRVTMLTDYTEPTTPDCERYLFVLDVTNETALRDPLDKWMESDGAERKTLALPDGDEVYYWEIAPPEDTDELDDGLLPVGGGGNPLLIEFDEEHDERVLRRAAVCLHEGSLAIGSDVEFLRVGLLGVPSDEALSSDADFRAAKSELDRVAPGERAMWTFTRGDEAFRPTYEMIRQNNMPQSQTFFGRLLNRFLTTNEEREAHLVREQKVDGSSLPEFEVARPYLGPTARSTRSDDDGWVISGVVLRKSE